jgi:hypothetical protein
MLTGLAIVVGQAPAFATGVPNVPITVTPSTGLTNGASVTITGSGFTDSSIGNVVECNEAPNEPTVALPAPVSAPLAVGCNAPSYKELATTTASGGLSATFAVVQGSVGPPCGTANAVVTCPATDSDGVNPAADAANYPCPPTAAQQAAGVVCQLTYGDSAGDSSTAVTITFQASTPPTTAAPTTATTKPPTPATTVAPATGATTATTAPTVAPAPATGRLATTGPGPAVGWLGLIGGLLLLFGLLLLLVLLDIPRRAFAVVSDRDGNRRVPARFEDSNGSPTRHVVKAASIWVGQFKGVGHRLRDSVVEVPGAARGLTHRVVSESARTAAWFLGR